MRRGRLDVLHTGRLMETKIIQNMETPNLELKKLNYLYVINYAKTHPDIVILAINSFRKVIADNQGCLGG